MSTFNDEYSVCKCGVWKIRALGAAVSRASGCGTYLSNLFHDKLVCAVEGIISKVLRRRVDFEIDIL